MIDANTYCKICKLKKTQVFVAFMKNLEYQADKEVGSKIDLKSVMLKKYYDFLDVFSQKILDILSLYQKYNHEIIFEK